MIGVYTLIPWKMQAYILEDRGWVEGRGAARDPVAELAVWSGAGQASVRERGRNSFRSQRRHGVESAGLPGR